MLRTIGGVSGAAFGLAVATAFIQGGLYDYRSTCVVVGVLIGAAAGFFGASRIAGESEEAPQEGFRTLTLNMVFSLYHVGAVLLFAALFAWGSEYDLTWGYSSRRVYLELAILGYAFLRFWHLLAKIWIRTLGEPPLFFVGLYLGTFPTLIFVMSQMEELNTVSAMVNPFYSVLSFPLRAAEVINFEYFNWIRGWSLYILAASFGWAFIFLLFDVWIIRRRAKKKT